MSLNFGNTFGTGTTSTPTFNFGSNTATNKGVGFGSTTTTTNTATPSFGFSSGSTGFGTGTSGFGTNTFGSSFGTATTNVATVAPTFSFSAPTTTTQSIFAGFGQTQPSASTFSGFGTKPFGTGTSSFGNTGTGTSFGGNFGSGFGTGTSFGVGQPQQQQIPATPNDALFNSILNSHLYGDERDQAVMKLNLIQALWGCGKGYFAPNAAPFEYTPQNTLCRLKSVGYSMKPTSSQSDALIAISINKKPGDIRSQQTQFESSILQILGNKPNITVHVDCIKPVSDIKSLVMIYVQEKTPNGSVKRISNSEVSAYLLQPTPKQQLVSMGVDNVYCFIAPKDEQLAEYYETTPAGIDPRIWKQAQTDNPDPKKFIPVPIVGFDNIKWRLKCQENESNVHETLLNNISEEISNLHRERISIAANINEYKHNLVQLEHRILKAFVKLVDCTNSGGIAFGPEEEAMKIRLENLHTALNKPENFKNRISEIVTALRFQDTSGKKGESIVDDDTLTDFKEFLSMHQKAISNLKEMVENDVTDLAAIETELKKISMAD